MNPNEVNIFLSVFTLIIGVAGFVAYSSKIYFSIKEQRRINKILKNKV